jgi:hypothetical protein
MAALPSKMYWINILAGSLSDDSDFVAALGGRWVPPVSWVDMFKRTEYFHEQSFQMFFESFPKNTFNPKDFLDVYIDLLYLSAE